MSKKIPDIRFKGYTDAWEQRKLSELFLRGGSGGTPRSTNRDYYNGNIPFLGISDISNSNGFINKTEKNITEEGLNNSSAWIVPSGSISLAMYASVGKLAILNTDAATSQAFYNMVFDDDNLRNYIYQRLSKANDSGEWVKLISTGTQANLNADKVKNFEISIPTENIEVSRISDFFMKIDNLITLHQRKLDITKELKKGLLQKIFPKNGESIPELRFSGYTEAWEQRKLGDVVDLLKDGTHGTHKDGEDAFLLSAKNIKNGLIIIDELTDRKIPIDDYNSIFKNYNLMNQDLLITIVGTIGQTALYKETSFKLAFQRSVAIIRGNKNVDQNFLKSTMDSNYIQKQLKQSASMSAQAGVYLGDLEKLTINIPILFEQKKIGEFFKDLNNHITLHQRKLDSLKELKKGFLQKMFV